ncbi:DUF2497 domain-containing protein [Hellea balneolensis]|uniref:DUF2497 domain-containing protein n=1 Tax=Hellea balneolensis TaxID=287478 RepID=UPI00041DCBB9|nr:DUF2497 domain-containing protein [Hellea balneolensis]
MSEQTTDTHNGVSDGQDPSMEDILASIRKIIAEDDAPGEALSKPADIFAPQDITGDVADLVEDDILDLNIAEDTALESPQMNAAAYAPTVDNLIGDMDPQGRTDLEIPELEVLAPEDDTLGYDGGSNDVLDLLIPMEEDSTPQESSLAVDATASETVTAADELDLMAADLVSDDAPVLETVESLQIEPPEDDLSALLDNMLEDSSSFAETEISASEELPIAQETVIDPAADLLEDDDILSALDQADIEESVEAEITAESGASQVDPDMMLVKSLMADLTEEPLHEVEASTEDQVALELSAEDDDTNDVLDDILSVTLDEEAQLSEETVAADAQPELEIQEPQEIAQEIAIETTEVETTSEPAMTLKEIAAQAEADAQSADAGLVAAAASVATVGAATLLSSDDEDDENIDDDVETEPSELLELIDEDAEAIEDLTPDNPDTIDTESTIEETPDMPTTSRKSAKKTDSIIDEVTESATAGAFASLTSVVEEKATVAERGDRIGDLVMEALQPMLKEWLDANLKGIVERAVTKEVKRISSGK